MTAPRRIPLLSRTLRSSRDAPDAPATCDLSPVNETHHE
jgi:hypothetical protein